MGMIRGAGRGMCLLGLLGVLPALGGCKPADAGANGAADVVVSQRSHAFAPGNVTLERGARMAIVNDDGSVIHHAYVDSKPMRFDSGDQPPGARAILTFEEAGRFRVLCGIHPRMRLDVEVRERTASADVRP